MWSIKSLKHIAVSAIITLSIFAGIAYSSCSKDACKGVTCLNGGTCSGGSCMCAKPGIGGPNCETIYSKLYVGTFTGNASYSADSNFKNHIDPNNQLILTQTDTTNYNNMQLVWTRPGLPTVSLAIVLTNNSASGSDFTVSGALDSASFGGGGAINYNSASANLVETFPHSEPIVITLTNFTRQ